MQFTNLDLLPQKKDSMLIDRKSKIQLLRLTEKITTLSIQALETFFNKEFSKFDAQVGENLCQIRAYKILLLGNDLLKRKTSHLETDLSSLRLLSKKIKFIIKSFENLLKNETCYNDKLDKKETLISFFKKNDININISYDALFLILSYLLYIFSVREDGMPRSVDYKKIFTYFNISMYASKKIIHSLQEKITQLGSDFIVRISQETPDTYNTNHIIPALLKTTDENRSVLPCYTTTLAILNNMIEKELPILAIIERKNKYLKKIDEIMILLHGNKSEHDFKVRNDIEGLNTPCIIIRGDVIYNDSNPIETPIQYSKRFLNIGLMDILLHNAATHPQYSGEKLFSICENPFQHLTKDNNKITLRSAKLQSHALIEHKKLALTTGCCKENPYLFYLKHFLCNTIYKETNTAKEPSIIFPYRDKIISETLYANAI